MFVVEKMNKFALLYELLIDKIRKIMYNKFGFN